MLVEYFEDAQPFRVVLFYDFVPDEIVTLRTAIEQLIRAEPGYEVQLDRLPGFVGVDGCSLVAGVGDGDVGVEPIAGAERELRCVLRADSWQQALGLLEPFLIKGDNGFQYLDEAGSVEWIISRVRGW